MKTQKGVYIYTLRLGWMTFSWSVNVPIQYLFILSVGKKKTSNEE
jgi:hypothetical protein